MNFCVQNSLPLMINAWLMIDRWKISRKFLWLILNSFWLIETGKFSVFRFMTNPFFHASFVFGFTCIALFSLSILHFCNHISHSLVSHTIRIDFAKLGTQLYLKIDWLIFDPSVHFNICYFFLTCELLKIGNFFF